MSRWFEHPRSLVWILLAYLPLLWLFGVPLTGDQKTYIAIALELLESGTWLQPLLFGEPCYLKPPLQYWATVLSWKVLGLSWFSTVLPSVLCLVGTAALLNGMSVRAGGRGRAGLWFAAMACSLTYALSVQMEIYLVFFATLAWALALRWGDSGRALFLYAAFAAAGLLSIVKSPLYSVFWTVSFLAWVFWGSGVSVKRGLQKLKNPHLYGAIALGIFCGIAWYLWIYSHDGARFWEEYVVRESIAKQGGNGSRLGDFWLSYWGSLFPASFFAVVAVVYAFFGRDRHGGAAPRRLWLLWMLPPALFFSWFPYRTETYLYVLTPVVAWILDHASVAQKKRWQRAWTLAGVLTSILVICATALLFWLATRWSLLSLSALIAVVALGLISAFLVFAGVIRQKSDHALVPVAFLVLLLAVRIGAIDLGQKEMKALHEARARIASGTDSEKVSAPIFYWNEGKDIWTESVMIGAAMNETAHQVVTENEALDRLRRGEVLVLADHQWPAFRERLRARLEPKESLSESVWTRWSRRGGLSLQRLIRESPPQTLTRDYWLVKLKK